jgi:hypothetical protein
MLTRSRQRGMGWFGLVVLFAVVGFVSLVVFKAAPVYLNQMKVARAVKAVAADAPPTVNDVRSALQRYWDIEDIVDLTPRDVRVVRAGSGRLLRYEYEARRHLFGNVSLVFSFADDVPMSGAGP